MRNLFRLALGVAAFAFVSAAATPASASHLTGYDLSHSIDASGTVTFVYQAFHRNNLMFPSSVRPSTEDRYLHFGDGGLQGMRPIEQPLIPFCDTDFDGKCRIAYRDCSVPNDARKCATAITTRVYTHDYDCTAPTDIFEAFITRTPSTSRLECCRVANTFNIPRSNDTPIRPTSVVTPCCENNLGEPNNGPSFSGLPVFNAFQDVRYLHPLGASDPDGDPLTLAFRTEPKEGNYTCPFACPTPPTPASIPLYAWDPCQEPDGAIMTIAAPSDLDWDMPISGVSCDQTRLGFYGVGVIVTDECGATATREFRLEVFGPPDSEPPELTLFPKDPPGLVDICIDEDTVVIDLEAVDPDVDDTVTLFVDPDTVPNTTFTQTPGNPATGQFTFSPKSADAQLGSFGFTFSAQDDGTPIQTDSESVVIEVIDCGEPPVADAGGPYEEECQNENTTVIQLDGSASFDPDGETLLFTWRGPFGTIGGNATDNVVEVELPLGTHEIELEITGEDGETATDTVKVTVVDTTAPSASAALVELGRPGGNGSDDNSSDDDSSGSVTPTHRISATASDLCDESPTVSATLNGRAVTDGQEVVIQFKRRGSDRFKVRRGILVLQTTKAVLTVTATDASGNSGSASAELTGKNDDDSSD